MVNRVRNLLFKEGRFFLFQGLGLVATVVGGFFFNPKPWGRGLWGLYSNSCYGFYDKHYRELRALCWNG